MKRKFRLYFDVNIWERINIDFTENKNHPEVWNIFKEQENGKVEIYCSEIHKLELRDKIRFEKGYKPDIIEAKIKQCFEKSNKIAETIIFPENFNELTQNAYLTNEAHIKKFNQLKDILEKTNKNENTSRYDAYHLLTCFINDIDVFLTDDKNILINNRNIKNLFNLWGKKNFIISTPEGYQRFKKYLQLIINGVLGISAIIIMRTILKLDLLSLFLGFGVFLNLLIFSKIFQVIEILNFEKISTVKISKALSYMKIFFTFFYPIFAIYSAFLFILSSNEIRNAFFSSIWLLLLIFVFQIPLLYLILYMINNKFKKEYINGIFTIGYIILSAMFGWSSAYLAHDVLLIPMLPDLTVATYGTLILLYLFLKYLDEEIVQIS